MIHKTTKTILRTLALALTICATSAWAIDATEVWEADQFKAASSGTVAGKNGSYNLTYNTSNDTVDTTNGKITIGGTKGLMITGINSANAVSVLIKYSGVNDTCTANRSIGSISVGSNYPGVESSNTSRSLQAYYGTTKKTIDNSPVLPSGTGYILLSYSYSNYFRAFVGSSLENMTGGVGSGIRWQSQTVSSVSVGGPNSSDSNSTAWSGLVIEKVALFVGNAYAGSDMLGYTFPSDDPTDGYDYATTISENTTLSDITTWAKGTGTPGASSKVYIACENNAVLTISGDLSLEQLKVVGGSITLADGASLSSMQIIGADINIAAETEVSVSDADISNKITCNGVLNTAGTTYLRGGNVFASTSTLNVGGTRASVNAASTKLNCNINVLAGATLVNLLSSDAKDWTVSNTIEISGTLDMGSTRWTLGAPNAVTLHEGGVITGGGDGNGALNWNVAGSPSLTVDGDATISAAIKIISTATLTINVAENKSLTIDTNGFLSNGKGNVTKTGLGSIKQTSGGGNINTLTVSQGSVTSSVLPSDNVSIASGATYSLKNVAWENNPSRFSGEGTLVLDTVSAYRNHKFLGSSFTGKLRVVSSGEGEAYHAFAHVDAGSFSGKVFTGRPEFEVAGDVRIYHSTSDKPFTIKNLSGSGYFKNYNTYDSNVYKYVDTEQTANTVYSGVFKASSRSEGDPTLTVRGADGATTTYSLTLSGESDTTAPLTIESMAKVVFSSTGKWSGGTVTVKDGGVLESENSAAIAATLKVEEGATLKFASGVQLAATAYDWSGVSNDGSVTIDLSAITPSATPVTLIASGVTAVTADKFTPTGAQRTATLSVDNGALKATFANYWRDGAWLDALVAGDDATLYISQDSTLTVSEALSLGTVTVVKEGEDDLTLTISGAGALTTAGWTIPEGVTVNTPASMSISGTVSGDGVINVPANTTLTMDDVTCSTKVTVSGTLETTGTTTLSGANTSAAGSSIEVQGGITTLSSDWQCLNSDITIASGATLKLGESLYGGSNYRYNCINPNASAILDVSGTLDLNGNQQTFGSNLTMNLRNGGNITTTTDGYSYASYYADIVLENTTLNVYGGGTVSAYIRMPDNTSSSIMVDGSSTLTIASKGFATGYSTYTAGGSIIKAGAGTLDLTAITPTKPITINAGTVVAVTAPTTAVVNEAGVLKLTNTGAYKDDRTVNLSGITGTGTIRYNGSGWRCLPNSSGNVFADTLSVELEQESGVPIVVDNTVIGSISGSKNLRSDLGSSGKTFTVKQAKDGVWSGSFHGGWDGLTKFVVQGGASSTGTLTLAGTTTADGTNNYNDELEVASSGSVNLTGSWIGDTTVYGEFGGTGSLTGALTFNAGSTFKVWATDADGLVATGALTLPVSGKVTVDVSDLSLGANDSYQILTVGSGLENTSSFAELDSETHMLSVSSGTLYVVPIAATVTSGLTVTKCSSVDGAIGTMVMGGYKDAYVTVLRGTTTYTEEQLATYNIVYDSSDSTYSIAAAQIDSTKYGTLAKAIAAAESSGDTVTLLRNTSVQNIALGAKSITLDENSNTFTGSFTGSGTIILGAPLAAADPARWAEGWTGTVWLQNLSDVTIVPANYGNADSVIKFTGVSGQIAAGTICSPAVELEDDGDTKALTLNSYSATTASTITFNEFRGSGTFATVGGTADAYPRTTFRILKWDDFEGSLDVDRGRAVFGTDTISNDDWRYIYISEDADVTIAAGKSFTANQGLRVYGELTVESNDALSSKAIQGSGTIIYEAAPNSGTTAPTFDSNYWTGTVELPVFSAGGIKLAEYGTSNSKIKINGITSGHLMWENQNVQAEVVLAGDVNITATSHRNYTYAHMSGTGSFSVSNSNTSDADPSALTITRLDVASGSVGMAVTNNTSTTLNIGTLALPEGAPIAGGTKLLTIGGTGSFSVGSVTVGGVTQSGLQLVYVANDGVYVACASYGGNGYISVAAAIDAAVAADGDVSTITILDGSTTLPAGYEQYYIDNGTIFKYQAAKVTPGPPLATTYYETLAAAIVAADPDSYIEVLADNVEATSNASSLYIKSNGHTFTITSSIAGFGSYTPGMEMMPGVYSYTSAAHEATFVWKDNVASGEWNAANNWTSTDGTVESAPRNSSLHNVSFTSDADVALASDITIGTLEIGAAVTLDRTVAENSHLVTATDIVLTAKSATITLCGNGTNSVTLSATPRTSLGGGAKVVSETVGNNTVYKVVYGTIFSVY